MTLNPCVALNRNGKSFKHIFARIGETFVKKGLFTQVNSIEIQGENTATGKVKVKCLTSAAYNHMVIEDGQYIT